MIKYIVLKISKWNETFYRNIVCVHESVQSCSSKLILLMKIMRLKVGLKIMVTISVCEF